MKFRSSLVQVARISTDASFYIFSGMCFGVGGLAQLLAGQWEVSDAFLSERRNDASSLFFCSIAFKGLEALSRSRISLTVFLIDVDLQFAVGNTFGATAFSA